MDEIAPYAAVYVPAVPAGLRDLRVVGKMVALGESQPWLPPRRPRDEAIEGLSVAHTSADRIEAHFTATAACTAVVAESYYPYCARSSTGSTRRRCASPMV